MEDKKYNGWNTYETWLTALWAARFGYESSHPKAAAIDNDYSSYQYCCELVEQVKAEHEDNHKRENCLALNIKNWIEEQNPITESSSLFTDLINSALSEVDWQEIAENFLAE
jgi:hypothetical protein